MCRYGLEGQMKYERLTCPNSPKLSIVTDRCLNPKLQITATPRNSHRHFASARQLFLGAL